MFLIESTIKCLELFGEMDYDPIQNLRARPESRKKLEVCEGWYVVHIVWFFSLSIMYRNCVAWRNKIFLFAVDVGHID